MSRRWPALLLSFLFALLLTGPVLAQVSTPEASPAAEGEPKIDLREFGAWGVATRDFEQSETDLDYPIILSTSLAAFPDAETATDAFPLVRDRMLELPEYAGFELIDEEPIGDDQFFLYGEMEARGYTYNVGLLVVLRGQYLTLAAGISYETLDIEDVLIALATDTLDRAGDAGPESGDDLLDALPAPDELPGADTIPDPYLVTNENTRLAD